MKKLLCLILCLFMISGCQQASTNHIKKDSSLSGIHEITYEQLQKKLKSDELFALYIGRPDCGDCREFEQAVKHIKNSGYQDVNVILFDKMRHEILNEQNKQEVYNSIINFLGAGDGR